jgi:hypothetical protein
MGGGSVLSDALDLVARFGPASPSLKALTLTGATVGTIADDAIAFVIGVIDGLLDVADLGAAGVDAEVLPLEAFETWVWWSEECGANDKEVGDWRRDDDVDNWMGDTDNPVSSLMSAIEPLDVGVVAFWLVTEPDSILSLSPLCDDGTLFSFATPTTPLKRLYNPLRPFCMISPARLLLSMLDEEGGGEANSLNVVRASEWDAVLWIWSRAWANCSLSIGVDPEREDIEPRRDLIPRLSKGEGPIDALGESWEDMALFSYCEKFKKVGCRLYQRRSGVSSLRIAVAFGVVTVEIDLGILSHLEEPIWTRAVISPIRGQ